MKIKVLSHEVEVQFLKEIYKRQDREGEIDHQAKIARVVVVTDDEKKQRPLSNILVILLHELGHEVDKCTCSNLFEGEDGENKLTAISEVIAQVLLDNGIISSRWLAELRREIKDAAK